MPLRMPGFPGPRDCCRLRLRPGLPVLARGSRLPLRL